MSSICISFKRKRFSMISDSCSSIEPSSSPISAIAAISSLLTLSSLELILFDRVLLNHTNGKAMTIKNLIRYAEGMARLLQKYAPIVFGSISEKTKIQNVRTAEAIATAPDPYKYNTWAPIPAAPKVCEMVFKVNIAANGRLISSLSFCNIFPCLGLVFTSIPI